MISAFFVGIAGGLYAPFIGSVYPQFGFDPNFDLAVAVLVFVGGIGTLAGPVIGALLLIPLQQYFYLQFGNANLFLIAYGLLFVLILRLLPGGIAPSVIRLWRWFLVNRRRAAAGAGPPDGVPAPAMTPAARPAGRRARTSRAEGDRAMSILDVTDISKSYGGIRALAGCTMAFEEGAINGLIGPNGSGKTTLFNVISGYERADAGQVTFRGTDVTSARPETGLRDGPRPDVPDHAHLPAADGDGEPARRVAAARLPRAGPGLELRGRARARDGGAGFRRAHPAGVRAAGGLSYGQQKLLEFAFIMVAKPLVILLDEPAGGVNPTLLRGLADRIRALNSEGVTFVIVEHDMSFVMGLCDRVLVMHQGCTLTAGAPEEVRSNPDVLEAYLGADPKGTR